MDTNQIKEMLSRFHQWDKNDTKFGECFSNCSNLYDTMAQQEYQMYQIRGNQTK